jgi:hypothetical protein
MQKMTSGGVHGEVKSWFLSAAENVTFCAFRDWFNVDEWPFGACH